MKLEEKLPILSFLEGELSEEDHADLLARLERSPQLKSEFNDYSLIHEALREIGSQNQACPTGIDSEVMRAIAREEEKENESLAKRVYWLILGASTRPMFMGGAFAVAVTILLCLPLVGILKQRPATGAAVGIPAIAPPVIEAPLDLDSYVTKKNRITDYSVTGAYSGSSARVANYNDARVGSPLHVLETHLEGLGAVFLLLCFFTALILAVMRRFKVAAGALAVALLFMGIRWVMASWLIP